MSILFLNLSLRRPHWVAVHNVVMGMWSQNLRDWRIKGHLGTLKGWAPPNHSKSLNQTDPNGILFGDSWRTQPIYHRREKMELSRKTHKRQDGIVMYRAFGAVEHGPEQ